jgi:hypothetical protein
MFCVLHCRRKLSIHEEQRTAMKEWKLIALSGEETFLEGGMFLEGERHELIALPLYTAVISHQINKETEIIYSLEWRIFLIESEGLHIRSEVKSEVS